MEMTSMTSKNIFSYLATPSNVLSNYCVFILEKFVFSHIVWIIEHNLGNN